MTGETPEVRSDKRKPREKKGRKRERREKNREKDVQGQLLLTCIQFSKRKTKYIGRNAQNLKKWPLLLDIR